MPPLNLHWENSGSFDTIESLLEGRLFLLSVSHNLCISQTMLALFFHIRRIKKKMTVEGL